MHNNGLNFEVVLNQIEQHRHDLQWQDRLLLLIAQQTPENVAIAIHRVSSAQQNLKCMHIVLLNVQVGLRSDAC